ncbi:phosphotransferase [Ferrovum sp. PN-J185]|uniref:aminoglycoside phosphotransferase family protein n=1 Tax=Ferrovum sp. PN-J185 TaxID=1356306 RepID=UPI0007942278|nr:phosphotransferase [Ferrovum sp. PN-J185]KXW55501.1 methylthioribose kinase [Ferrovum sp. PN-J185]MCC6067942.1 phosphotransferase [Ferrovum sp. PN-J185]MDE1891285.1 phosphotransferase [Betaproteobacteria bacterium]MDE2056325.1 phosphotransferase [Betaproteobacteria bacterium]
MDLRFQELISWLNESHSISANEVIPASSDASNRRYYRFNWQGNSFIVMDAPPDLEDCHPFLHVQQQLYQVGVSVPEIFRSSLERGFLLLTDFGSETFLNRVTNKPQEANLWYVKALKALIPMQKNSLPKVFPDYSEDLLRREMSLFRDWYVAKEKQVTLSPHLSEALSLSINRIVEHIKKQPKVWVHRDYHSRNLMITKDNLGIIDFQDAVYGPITYDAVSLLRDAYIQWSEEQQLDWLIRYWQELKKEQLLENNDFSEFYRDFEMMGIQRHLKVVGIFARLAHRDNKQAYLQDIPRVWGYLRAAVSRYNELSPLMKVLDFLEDKPDDIGYTF